MTAVAHLLSSAGTTAPLFPLFWGKPASTADRPADTASDVAGLGHKHLWLNAFSWVDWAVARPLLRRERWYGGTDAGPLDRPAVACLWGPVASTDGTETSHPIYPVSWA